MADMGPGLRRDEENGAMVTSVRFVPLVPIPFAAGAAAGRRREPGTIRGEHPNACAVAGSLEQCETERGPPGPEHASDQPLIVLRHPVAPSVLGDFEMVRRQYRPRRKVGHGCSADPVDPVARRLGDAPEKAMHG
jgi:hypothetical protein